MNKNLKGSGDLVNNVCTHWCTKVVHKRLQLLHELDWTTLHLEKIVGHHRFQIVPSDFRKIFSSFFFFRASLWPSLQSDLCKTSLWINRWIVAKLKLKAYLNCIAVDAISMNTWRVFPCEIFSVVENLFKLMVAFSYGFVLALLFGTRSRVLAKTTVNCDA